MNKKVKALVLCAVMALFFVGCADSDLQKVAKGLDVTAQSIGVLQTAVIEANSHGLISEADTTKILTLAIKVNQAGKDAVAITRAISKLDNPSAKQLLTILTPIIIAVNDMLDNGLIGIKDPATVQKIRGVLLTIQTTLNAIQITLTTGN